ncbi:MAG TPA: hypothetical protein VL996_13005 [Methylocella sp.]|nr:hypothetical protein [Methylocella sp.]
MAANILNAFLYIYTVRAHGLYRFPVLLIPKPYFGRLLLIFAFTALLVTGLLFFLRDTLESLWPFVATLSLQIILLFISRWAFAKAMRALLSAERLDGRRVMTIGEPAELMGLSASFILQCFGQKEVYRMSIATKRRYGTNEIFADLDHAITIAREKGASEYLIALRWGSQDLLETVRSRLRASPLPVRILPDHSIRTLLGQHGGFADAIVRPVTIQKVQYFIADVYRGFPL